MKKIHIIICALFSLLFLSCEEDKYYQGEYIIINDTNEAIDCYAVGRNISAPSVGIHDHIPANSRLSLRKVNISEKTTVKGIFESIEIYQNAQKAIKNPMEHNIWVKALSNNQLTYTLVVDDSFFR
jgi:hypothetical protein